MKTNPKAPWYRSPEPKSKPDKPRVRLLYHRYCAQCNLIWETRDIKDCPVCYFRLAVIEYPFPENLTRPSKASLSCPNCGPVEDLSKTYFNYEDKHFPERVCRSCHKAIIVNTKSVPYPY